MNILVINHYAGNPQLGMEFRPYYLAKEWVKTGNNVMIIGGTFSHLRKQQPKVDKENIDGIEYRWIPVSEYKGNGLGRIKSMFDFVRKLWFGYKKILGDFKPDVVIASSTYPLDIYPAHKIAKHYGARLVYEVHDLWPLSPMELGGYSQYHPFIMVMQKAEDYCYKHADKVVSLLPNALDHMKERGMDETKFIYVPNGFDPEEWAQVLNHNSFSVESILRSDNSESNNITKEISRLHNQGKFIVGFAGAHGIANSLYAVIDAVKELSSRNIILILIGSGSEKNNLIKYTKEKNIANVKFFSPIEKTDIPAVLSLMDCLYIGLQKQPLFRFGISPNKMFDYMMAAKPVIQAIDAGNNMVREAKNGIDVEPDNVNKIRTAILEINNMDESKRKEMGLNGRNYALKYHSYSILADRFVSALK